MKNYEVAEDLIRKLKNSLKNLNFFYPLDEILLIKLQDAMLADTSKQYLQHMLELEKELEKLYPRFGNLTKLKIYFNFKDWKKAKASNKDFSEIILSARRLL